MNSHTVVPVGPKKQEKSLTSSLNSLSINLQTKEDDRTLRHFSALSTITSFPCLETRDYLLVVSRRPAFNCNCCLRVREGNGNPLQYSCLENPMDGGAWWAAVHGVSKSRAWLSDFTFTFHFPALEKEMATHSSVLAWRIPGMRSLVGCCLWGRTESDSTEAT